MRILVLLLFIFLIHTAQKPSLSLEEEAQLVYQQLQQAIGDQRPDFPSLEILDRELNAAAYRQTDNKLILEQTALKLCASLGEQRKAAIAFLLGHELTHFYQHQDWGTHTCWSKGTSLEAEADLHGAFLAYLAGYEVEEVAPQILTKIYAHYQLDKKLPHYPILAERQALAKQALSKLKVLESIHNHAAILVALGFHQEAFLMYEHLLKQLKTKSLYNNLGVSLWALAWSSEQQKSAFTYHYPIELHSALALNPPTRSTQGIINTRQLLIMAKRNFEQAKTFDQQDFSVWLNLACTQNLLASANWDEVWDYINHAEKRVQTPLQLSKLSILKGIVYGLQHKKALALKEFGHATQSQTHLGITQLVDQNIKHLNKQPVKELVYPFSKNKEQIDEINLRNYQQLEADYELPLLPIEGLNSELSIKYLPHSQLLVIPVQKQHIVIQSTNSQKVYTQAGLTIGDQLDDIQEAYKQEEFQSLNMDKGYLVLIPSQRLFFRLDEYSTITTWGIYLKQVSS